MFGSTRRLLLLLAISLLSGCADMQDMIIRGMHMDYGYQDDILPVILDRYQQNMQRREPARLAPRPTVPPWTDQG